MLPDFSEYNWVIPDFVWELSEQIDFGKHLRVSELINGKKGSVNSVLTPCNCHYTQLFQLHNGLSLDICVSSTGPIISRPHR